MRRTERDRVARPRREGVWGRVLLGLASVLVLAGIVHLVSILTMPALAQRSAFQRLSAIAGVNQMQLLPAATAEGAALPMADPAFVTAVCLYDLEDHSLKIRVPATLDYTSVSFYTQYGASFYALSDQATAHGIELELLSPAQRAALPEDEEITAADRLIVESPSMRGLVLVRAFARHPDLRDTVRQQLEAASCAPSAPPGPQGDVNGG